MNVYLYTCIMYMHISILYNDMKILISIYRYYKKILRKTIKLPLDSKIYIFCEPIVSIFIMSMD